MLIINNLRMLDPSHVPAQAVTNSFLTVFSRVLRVFKGKTTFAGVEPPAWHRPEPALAVSMQKRTADERRWTQIPRQKNADLSVLLRRHGKVAPS
jgi:hypothetical protein